MYVGSYLKAVSTEQLVNRASWLWCVCACVCVCRRVPRVVARCRSAGHVALIWNCQRLLWQQGKQRLSAPGVRERWRRRNEAQTFSWILCTAPCFSHTPAFHFLLSPPVSFVFLSSLIVFLISVTSLPLSISLCLTVCPPCEIEVWEAAGSIVEKARERVREGKSVRARRCERGRWETGGEKERVRGKLKREDREGEEKDRGENVDEPGIEKEVKLKQC